MMVERVSRAEAASYLRRYGISSESKVTEILSGFDFAADRPAYLMDLGVGERYFQFVRTPSFELPDPVVGSWFCLKGSGMSQLAIHSPGAVRLLGEFEVVEDIMVLEGIAKELPFQGQPTKHGVGGRGGGTQIYVPPRLSSGLRYVRLAL
jgi:hypothetical protein